METGLTNRESRSFAMASDESTREEEDKRGAWRFLWVLFVFKIVTVLATFWAAGFTRESSILLSLTTWPWLIIAAIGIAGPLAFKFRLHRVRARREALQRSEWMLET